MQTITQMKATGVLAWIIQTIHSIGKVSAERLLLVVLFMALIPAYVIALASPAVGYYHDDGVYVVTAKALAEGHGYRIISMPHEPAQTKYPIILPALLATVWSLFPTFPSNATALKLVPFSAALVWLLLVKQLLSEELRQTRAALWITWVVAASPLTIFLSTTILADIPFAAFVFASLLCLRRIETPDHHRSSVTQACVAAVFAALSFHTKTAGVTVLVAGCLTLLLKRRVRQAAVFAVTGIVLSAPWLIWQMWNSSAAANDPYNSWVPYYRTWNILTLRVSDGVLIVLSNMLHCVMAPLSAVGVPVNMYGFAICLAIAAIGLVGLVREMRQGINVFHVFLTVYHAILLCWAWPPLRFLSLVLPFAAYYVLRGVERICGGRSRYAVCALTGACAVMLLPSVIAQAKTTITYGTPGTAPVMSGRQLYWPEFVVAMHTLRDTTNDRAVLLGNLDPTFYLYTGRKAIRGFQSNPVALIYRPHHRHPLGTAAELSQVITSARVTHIVDMPQGPFVEVPFLAELIADFIRSYPASVDTQHALANGYRMIRISPAKLTNHQARE